MNVRGKLLDIAAPAVMGILNITPDSFFAVSRTGDDRAVLERASALLQEGAGLLDIGGYSSRPGAAHITEEEELGRVIPVIELLSARFPGIVLSVDTFRARVAREAVDAGAAMVNDISAGDDDPEMIATVAALGVPFIAMHKKGTPQNMQKDPFYDDVVLEVFDYFVQKTWQLEAAGITDIILDPGFGFGKNLQHNYTLLQNLAQLKHLGYPILAGVSRKSMVTGILQNKTKDALNGTTVLHTLALLQGADMLRVHDVKEAVEAIKIVQAYEGTVLQ